MDKDYIKDRNEYIDYYKKHPYAFIESYFGKDLKWYQRFILRVECKLIEIKNEIWRMIKNE